MSKSRIAINGFGRIGRSFFRAGFGDKHFDIVAVNDLSDTKNLAYLLKYDSVYGRYSKQVEAKDGHFEVDGKEVKVFAEKEPANLPWKDLDIDIVVESTGFFANDKSKAHLDAGAKRVVITAPANGDVETVLVGVNDDKFGKNHPLTCNASCTTNSVAPVLQILLENFGIKDAMLTSVHGYTASQKLVDGPDAKDMRRGRAAGVNIIPSTTGASEAVIKAIPALEGKFDADSIRVPTITGSLSVITAKLGDPPTGGSLHGISKENINQVFIDASKDKRWEKVLKVTEDPIVSTDIIGELYGAIIDLSLTKVVGEDLVKIFSWYDNEAGYTATLVEHVKKVAKSL